MNDRNWDSLPQMLFTQAERLGDKPFLWRKRAGAWQATSYADAARQTRMLARGLVELGVEIGDRVLLLSESRPEWLIADHAIMAAGGITVPAYTTNTPADHAYLLRHSGAKGAIVSTAALAAKLLPAAREAPGLAFVIAIDDVGEGIDGQVAPPYQRHRWAAVLAASATSAAAEGALTARTAGLRRDAVCCLIYTSGTGGAPKGVMLSHRSILCNCRGAFDLLADFGLGDEVFLSFLPLSHSYEHTVGQFFPISIGAQIYYAEGVDKLMDNLAEVRPTIMTAVPRLYESLHQRILRGTAKSSRSRRRLFQVALKLGGLRYAQGGKLSLLQRLLDLIVDRLVRGKVRQRFGGRLKVMVSGGAALNPDIGLFFTALGLRILQGYGQTEAAPVISVNPPRCSKLHSVGLPLTGVDVKIAEDGEILVRGDLLMNGYWGDPEATASVLRDGWLHTGDIGAFDEDGYLQITDRKKDIIVLSGGDNVSPARVESMLALEPEIEQAMVHGDRQPHLVALVVPNDFFIAEWLRANGKGEPATLTGNAEFHKAVGVAVDRVNARLSTIERIRRFAIVTEPFSIDNGLLTPSLKIRRHKIRERHAGIIAALYERA